MVSERFVGSLSLKEPLIASIEPYIVKQSYEISVPASEGDSDRSDQFCFRQILVPRHVDVRKRKQGASENYPLSNQPSLPNKTEPY